MKRLVDIYRAQRMPCVVMMMHSSSLCAGYSPYCRTEQQLERFYTDMREIFEYCVQDCRLPSQTLGEFTATYRNGKNP